MRGIGDNGGPDLESPAEATGTGWVRVQRDIRQHHLVGFGKQVAPADPARGFAYSRAEAWLDLIMECRYRPGEVMNKGRRMRIEAGQLLGAISWLASRWNWTPKQVRTFLDNLEADEMIKRSEQAEAGAKTGDRQGSDENIERLKQGNQQGNFKGNRATVLSVCNYEIYQMAISAQRAFLGQVEGQPRGNQGAAEGQPKGNTLTKEQGYKGTKEPDYSESGSSRAPAMEPTAWRPREDTVRLSAALVDAAGPALDNPVNCLGLATCAVPLTWLANGCDLELDVLPTLRGFAVTEKGRRIRSWEFFTGAVYRQRDRRLKDPGQTGGAQTIPVGKLSDGWEISERGRVVLMNGVRAEWLKKFNGNEEMLDNALIAVSAKLRREIGAPSVEQQVESHLAEICLKRTESDGRYREAAERNAERRGVRPSALAGGVANSETPIESKADRLRREAKERMAAKASGGSQ